MAHILDIITTMIGLNIGAIESNKISAYFFKFGTVGLITNTIYVLSIFILLFYFIEFLIFLYKKLTGEEAPISLIFTIYAILSSTLLIEIIWAVVNNIFIISKIMT